MVFKLCTAVPWEHNESIRTTNTYFLKLDPKIKYYHVDYTTSQCEGIDIFYIKKSIIYFY